MYRYFKVILLDINACLDVCTDCQVRFTLMPTILRLRHSSNFSLGNNVKHGFLLLILLMSAISAASESASNTSTHLVLPTWFMCSWGLHGFCRRFSCETHVRHFFCVPQNQIKPEDIRKCSAQWSCLEIQQQISPVLQFLGAGVAFRSWGGPTLEASPNLQLKQIRPHRYPIDIFRLRVSEPSRRCPAWATRWLWDLQQSCDTGDNNQDEMWIVYDSINLATSGNEPK